MRRTIPVGTNWPSHWRAELLADWRDSLLELAERDSMLAADTMARSLLAETSDFTSEAAAAAIQQFFALDSVETAAVIRGVAEEKAIREAFDLGPEDTASITTFAVAA